MRVTVDQDVCGGHGECVVFAPEVFDFVGDDDVVSVLVPEPPVEQQDKVRKACATCPTGAINLEE